MGGEISVRTFATFNAEFPDDGVVDAAGNCITPAGKSVMAALAAMLRSQGARTTEVLQHSFYGWQFTVEMNQHHAWFLLQGTSPWLLLSQARPSLLEKLTFKKTSAWHGSILQAVNTCLAQDIRFREVRWYTKEEYERGKSRGPGENRP